MATFGSLRHTHHVVKSQEDRRREARLPFSEAVEVTVLDDTGQTFSGSTIDVSETGLSFTSPICITAGTTARIEVSAAVVLGEVRYSRPLGDESYAVGVFIEHECFGWERLHERARRLI
jgi:hypothetical protein